MSLFDLSGTCAVVVGTGGIGRVLALGLARSGARVVVADRDASAAADAAAELGREGGLGLAVDVTSETSVRDLSTQALAFLGKVDVLVNGFGITVRKRAEDLTLTDWQDVMDVNARGTFVCCEVFGKEMIQAGRGKIVNVSSVRGRFANSQQQAEYSASKGAVDALTRALAAQWGRFGVYVNAIAPTVVETPLVAPLLQDAGFADTLRNSIPLGRWGKPEDLVGPVIFLASAASDFVTGQVLYVDGGLTSRI